jgi:c-di-GMP-binding flagellar brake protein YcgR
VWQYIRENKRYYPVKEDIISVEILGKGFNQPLKLKDICLGGVAIYTQKDFRGNEIGNEIQIKLKLPDNLTLVIMCEIRHTELNNSYIGVQFIDLNKNSKNIIKKYVEKLKNLHQETESN